MSWLRRDFFSKCLLNVCASLLSLNLACSNKLSLSGGPAAVSKSFDGFKNSADQNMTSNLDLYKSASDILKDSSGAVVSALDQQSVLIARSDSKSLIVNLQDLKLSIHTANVEDLEGKADWTYALGENQYWAVGNGKIYYRAQVGNELSKIEEALEAILDEKAKTFRPIAMTKTDLIAQYKKKILWLSVDPQLKREFYLHLDGLSLGGLEKYKFTSGGVIAGRGVWLLANDYIVYILRDSNGKFSAETKRFKGFTTGKNKVFPKYLSMNLVSDKSNSIVPQGRILMIDGKSLYLSGSSSGPAKPSEPDQVTEPENETPVAPEQETPKPPPMVSEAELKNIYQTSMKSIIGGKCQPCHSVGNRSRLGSFEEVKAIAGSSRSKVDPQAMLMPPPNNALGLTLSDQERDELTKFFADLERLP